MSKLFESYQLGGLKLANRIVMAPLTRSRANADGVHGELAATYYRQRAEVGLIITEATAVSRQGRGYVNIPGIWNDAQTKGWQGVARAVHDEGGKIFMQLFHTGRVGHSSLFGEQPVSSTARPPEGQVTSADFSKKPYETPRILRTDEVQGIIAQFKTGAENAKKAGFDGIEIHAANGYLIDQFLRDGVNDRTDDYGGTPENRARLLRGIVEAAVEVWGPGRIGARFSPYALFNSMSDADPVATYSYVAGMLNEFPLAYIHLTEMGSSEARGLTEKIRGIYKGTLIVNGGLTKENGEKLLNDGTVDLICLGAPFIANPDLVERLRNDLPLAIPNQSTFYTPGAKGYTDYPTARQQGLENVSDAVDDGVAA